MLWQKSGFVNKWSWRLQEVKRNDVLSLFVWAVHRTLAALTAAHTRWQESLLSQECAGIVCDGQVEVLWWTVWLQAAAGLPLVDLGGKSLFEAAVSVLTVLQTGHDHLSKVLLKPLEILPDRKRNQSMKLCFYCVCLIIVKWGSRCAVNTRFHSRCRWCWQVVCFPHHSC